MIEGGGRVKKEKGKKSETVGGGLSEGEGGGIQTNKKRYPLLKRCATFLRPWNVAYADSWRGVSVSAR